MKINHISLENLYKNDSFTKLCYEGGEIKNYDEINEIEVVRTISKKWLLSKSITYFEFILKLIENKFDLNFIRTKTEEISWDSRDEEMDWECGWIVSKKERKVTIGLKGQSL